MPGQSQNQFPGFSIEVSFPTECDVLVVGSGAGGLSAAVTAAFHGLKVIVAEKEPVFGGTTAWSGGWMWAPRNEFARRAGIVEDAELPRTYLRDVLGNNFNEAKVDAFLEAAPGWSRSSRRIPRSSSKTVIASATPTAMSPAPARAGARS
jgi:choline dehydrogenase-like flavoprotein